MAKEQNGKTDMGVPAIVINLTSQVGSNHTMSMQFGAPLDMTTKDLNAYIDKARSVMERQNNISLLEKAKMVLEDAEKQLITNREQRANAEFGYVKQWHDTQRKGDFKPTESQRAQLGNWDKTIKNLHEELIPKFKFQIDELEKKISAGV